MSKGAKGISMGCVQDIRKSSKIFFMYLGVPMLGAYIFTMFMSSWWILPLCGVQRGMGDISGMLD